MVRELPRAYNGITNTSEEGTTRMEKLKHVAKGAKERITRHGGLAIAVTQLAYTIWWNSGR